MSLSGDAIEAIERLVIPQGPLAGEQVRLAGFQRRFVEGLLADGVGVGCLSVGRGNGKTGLAASLAVAHLLGAWAAQPQREVTIAARTRDQAQVGFNFCRSFVEAMPELAGRVTIRKSPLLEIELDAPDGPHLLKAVPSTGKAVLGGAATFAILDERAAWMPSRGAELEAAILTSLGKRGGRCAIISTSAPDDGNDFSRWLDTPPSGTYAQEHRAADLGCAPDDAEALLQANPGCAEGIGATLDWLQAAGRQAAERGGAALAHFRNLHLNQRVNAEARAVLIELDAWLPCETEPQPERAGPVVIGLDLGGAASMSAAAFFWPATGRLEVLGWFPSEPGLPVRGVNDGVGRRYLEMAERGELLLLGGRTVPAAEWIAEVLEHVRGEEIAAVLADRFKQGEVGDALDAAGCRAPVTWRGFGWRDGAADIEAFRRMVHERRVAAPRSLLLRHALSDAVVMLDPAGNPKLAKGRALGRIDAAAAALLAIAEGHRMHTRPARSARSPLWI
jgi:phage terminase large subunit-like protein